MTNEKKLKEAKLHEIISGIPIPEKMNKRESMFARLKSMQVGDAIKLTQREVSNVRNHSLRLGFKMVTRKIDDEYFAWRVK